MTIFDYKLEDKIKGIILAGGLGTRLNPLTQITSKQLLPIYDKPLIYYPLSTLMLAGIREIAIISIISQREKFINLLGDGQDIGIKIDYLTQDEPRGIAESLLIAENFLNGGKCALILGDNVFHGSGLGRRLAMFKQVEGAQIFGYHVKNPESYGIATVDDEGNITKLDEKPKNSKSKIAIPGIYFFDENGSKFSAQLKPSPRGELEIIDLLKIYHQNKTLNLEMLPRGTAWFDSGTFEDLYEASTYVKLMQDRTGDTVGDPTEVASNFGWI
jgi:glucose-1-phosphate thymidylyltransferase